MNCIFRLGETSVNYILHTNPIYEWIYWGRTFITKLTWSAAGLWTSQIRKSLLEIPKFLTPEISCSLSALISLRFCICLKDWYLSYLPKPITFVTCVREILVWEQIPWLWLWLTTFLGKWFFFLLTDCTNIKRLQRAPDKSMSPEVGTDNLVPQCRDRGRCLEFWCWRKTKWSAD